VRDDLGCWVLFVGGRGGGMRAIGSRRLDRFVGVPASKAEIAMEAARLMDGTRSFDEIATSLEQRCGRPVDVRGLYAGLTRAGLAVGAAAPTVAELDRLSLRLVDLPVAAAFQRIGPPLARLLPVIAALAAAAAGVGAGIAWTHASRVFDVTGLLRQHSPAAAFALFGALMLSASLLHELAHGLVAARCGLVPARPQFRLYAGFVPVVTLRIPGLYTLPPGRRLAVFSAGLAANTGLAGLALVIWQGLALSGTPAYLALKFALCNLLLVAQNLVPFLPSDGYLIFTSLLRRSGVRSAALREFESWRAGRPHRFHGWLRGYFVASGATLLLLLGVALYLGSAGRALALLAGAVLVALRLRGPRRAAASDGAVREEAQP
jgi:hypothetical protein